MSGDTLGIAPLLSTFPIAESGTMNACPGDFLLPIGNNIDILGMHFYHFSWKLTERLEMTTAVNC
jgi:hypothetical protein